MSKKKILILGASRYYSKSIAAAKENGYYIIALDRNSESPGFAAADKGITCDIADKEGVLKVAKEYAVNGVVPLNDIGVPVAAYVSEALGLPGITSQIAALSSNKELMRKCWIEKGVPCPKVAIATTKEDFEKAFQYVGFPCILKPAHGLGGASRGVVVVNDHHEIEEAIKFSQSFYEDKTTLIETFVDAEFEHSAEVLIINKKVSVIAISDKIKTPLPYRVDKNVLYPTLVNGDRLEKLKQTIIDAVMAIGITNGAAHVELASTKEGFVLFELGARCGGGGTPEPIVHYCTGINLFVELVKILAGDTPGTLIPIRNYGANYHFITPKEGRIKDISGLTEISYITGVLDFDFFKKPGDLIPPVKIGTDRSGFIITGAPSREEAYRIGCLAEQRIEIEYNAE
jgi:biotin carboxylase